MQMNQHLSKKSNKHKWRSVSSGSALWQNNERSRLQKMKDSIHNIMTAHQRAKYKPEADKVRPSGQPEKKKKKGWSLPHWTVYIAWTRKCRFFFLKIYLKICVYLTQTVAFDTKIGITNHETLNQCWVDTHQRQPSIGSTSRVLLT